jgi:hypothetical protein
VEWDSAITLAFAAEHLFEAAQLLTSDLVPPERALKIAHEQHMVPLLENDTFLPPVIRGKLLAAQESYVQATSNEFTRDFARELASELMNILSEITATLSPIRTPSFMRVNPEAA